MARIGRSGFVHLDLSLPAGAVRAAMLLATLAGVLLWGLPSLLAGVGSFLMVEDRPSRSDAIVVLSGDGGARLEQGVELYMQSYAPLLILVGGGQEGRPPAAEIMRRQAVGLGVPASSILLVSQSSSTREDALYTRELMLSRGLRSAILVTSPYHQRRASMTFDRALEGSGISVASFPVQDDQWRPDSWWQSGSTLRLTVMELAKLAYYEIRGYLR